MMRNQKSLIFACLVSANLLGSLSRNAAADIPVAQTQLPEPGISRKLAIERASRLSSVRYELSFILTPHSDLMPGQETLHFQLTPEATQADLPIDYREGMLDAVAVNGVATALTPTNGHILLPATALKAGENTVQFRFRSRVAKTSSAITRFDDKEDGSEYIYSLFVPMDASMAFPCFDQPDIKARFQLNITAPGAWTVLSNTAATTTAPTTTTPSAANQQTTFSETKPISTYLFAFAAGPWKRVHPDPTLPDVWVRQSQITRAAAEAPVVQETTRQGMAWLTNYFHQPFPFPKYDTILIPEFPFGGMEHAGAAFLREDSVLFRTAPTAADRFSRQILVLHELTHQWFGDLVTMRWFDDLWLKEGFAQYMAYRCLDSLQPDSQAWKHFFEEIKPLAYGIDETPGTTPIFQDIPNLKDAKSAYGAIVYQKAPSILKQLEFWIGPKAFQSGLQMYLRDHAYGNAQWSDLVSALHTASGQDVRSWADAWVLRRGMPEIAASFSCDSANHLAKLTITQHDLLPDGYNWPIATRVYLAPDQSTSPAVNISGVVIPAQLKGATTDLPVPPASPCPSFVFPNIDDEAYGRVLLDATSAKAVETLLANPDQTAIQKATPQAAQGQFLHSMLWASLWENVRAARTDPKAFVISTRKALPAETDETLFRLQLARATFAMHDYLSTNARAPLVPQYESFLTGQLQASNVSQGLRINAFRALIAVAETAQGTSTLKDLLAGKITIPDVQLRQLDRWNIIGRLILLNDPDASHLHDAEAGHDHSDDGAKYAWAVMAGKPDAATKATYFAEYTRSPKSAGSKSEDWITQSLRPFNAWNQPELTAPYLRRALDQLPEIKQDRKIFFLGAWLAAFLGGQTSSASLDLVHQWLQSPNIDPDLRRKVLENADELERINRIRTAFPN